MLRQIINVLFLLAFACGGSSLAAAGEAVEIIIPADSAWVRTGVMLREGESFTVSASGSASVGGLRMWDWFAGKKAERIVGPEGTYIWPRQYEEANPQGEGFPLPAAAEGPWPVFCMIGKIGPEGEPFYVGRSFQDEAAASGELWLGVNDDRLDSNKGAFEARILKGRTPAPSAKVPRIYTPQELKGRPVENARVMVLYIDGLRPDVLHEMAEMGFLPNFKRLFIDGGLEFPYAFTVFPSNTLVSNGSLMTGYFSDRTGVKSQNQFERLAFKPRDLPRKLLSPWLAPRFGGDTRTIDLLDKYAPQQTYAFLRYYGVETITSRLGKKIWYTALPIIPRNPPTRWMHRAVNTIGPLGISVRLPHKLDEVNVKYAIEEMIGRLGVEAMMVWLPNVDKVSHYAERGQFGAARRELAMADRYLERILKRLEEAGWLDNMYFLLVSDHGHIGGEDGVNQHAKLASEWAFRKLGVNVKIIGHQWLHPGLNSSRYFFVDHQGWGQVKLFMPFGDFIDGNWARNRLYELQNYRLRPNVQPIDVIQSLHNYRASDTRMRDVPPVDLVLVKLPQDQVLISKSLDNQALLSVEIGEDGAELFRYRPVRDVRMDVEGKLSFNPAEPGQDPLGYLQSAFFIERAGGEPWLERAHSEEAWLEVTHRTDYPDAPVAFAKFFNWKGKLKELAPVRDPDVVVTAADGWTFREDGKQGTDHGYPLFDSMRITLFASGPGIPTGQNHAPARIVDIVPTILQMIGRYAETDGFDGRPLRGLYE